ncbi:hypothetical protein LPJ53_000016 [Coemansia erecta]|uniref:GYF domain-containing protein n=1 Tax=Coemansia erecta TaxID=147472 RepID=A0A9W8CTI5_9FUNG|nr:hypothetical protein LPJ53_000016 [Coemansia erecta]
MNGKSSGGKRESPKRVRFSRGSGSGSGMRSQDYEMGDDLVYGTGFTGGAYSDEYDSDENAALEADITTGKRHSRKVNTDGYGSDASDHDEAGDLSDFSDESDIEGGPKSSRKKESGGSNGGDEDDDEDDDMFGDSAEPADDESSASGEKKKRKRYLDIADIEGQEMDSTTRSEPKHEILVGKGKGKESEHPDDNEGEKVKIEAFNMKEDLEEGQFDAHGNFVWNKKDSQMYQDSWLDGISKTSISQARESKAQRDQQQSASDRSTANRWDGISNDDIIIAIINLLRPRETVINALARVGGPKKKTKKWGKKAKDKDNDKEKERRRNIEQITELADQAMSRGLVNIYDETYEQLVRQMRVVERIDEDWEIGTTLPTPALKTDTNVDKSSDIGDLLDDLDEL